MNQKGSSLPAVLFVIGVFAITSMALLSLVSNMEKKAARQVREEGIQDLINSLAVTMEDAIDCTNILGDNVFNNGIPTVEQSVVLKTTYGKDSLIAANYLQAGKSLGNGISISNITIQAISDGGGGIPVKTDMRFAYSALPLGNSSEAILTKYLAEVKFYVNGVLWNAGKANRKIRVFIKVLNFNNRIWSCHGLTSPAESCEIVTEGTYNPYMPNSLVDFRCNPDKKCFDIKGPVGGLFTTPACPNPSLFDPQLIGSVSGVNHYICNWCNKNRP